MFANIIFSLQFDLKQSEKRIEKEEDKILNTILKTFFDGFLTKNIFQKNSPNCNFAARYLLPNYLVSISSMFKEQLLRQGVNPIKEI
jgi:hypothetical protein